MINDIAILLLAFYAFGVVMSYVIVEIYAAECRRRRNAKPPSMIEKLFLALAWPYFVFVY